MRELVEQIGNVVIFGRVVVTAAIRLDVRGGVAHAIAARRHGRRLLWLLLLLLLLHVDAVGGARVQVAAVGEKAGGEGSDRVDRVGSHHGRRLAIWFIVAHTQTTETRTRLERNPHLGEEKKTNRRHSHRGKRLW